MEKKTSRFCLGQLVATPGVLAAVSANDLTHAVTQHLTGDWGVVNAEDQTANDWAVKNGGRILSAYMAQDGTKFWIITEADRSATTILLPNEY